MGTKAEMQLHIQATGLPLFSHKDGLIVPSQSQGLTGTSPFAFASKGIVARVMWSIRSCVEASLMWTDAPFSIAEALRQKPV